MSTNISALDPAGLAAGAAIFFGFVGALFIASRIVPGKREPGVPLEDGSRVTYTLNGFRLFLVVTAVTAAIALLRPAALAAVHTHFWPIFAVANVTAFSFSIYLTLRGRKREGRSRPGVIGFVVDTFYGVELNPTIAGVDLKMFSYRPSLMGLGLLNISFAAAQYHELGYITTRMWVYQTFYFIYLCNYFQFEYGMIYTWDIIAERFGWMLVWGDYVLVPFFYSIPGWYLLHDTDPMPVWQVVALGVLYVIGFVLFRGSNEQKHQFKADPNRPIWGKRPEALGGKLLVSGFWGIGRKLNYTGELLMYIAWSATTGTQSLVPYLLPLWLSILFPHRAFRDDQRCRAKYGDLWEAYCRRARFRMIPFLY
ncbi:Delta(24(24(1)))-sterol reductase [Minicystis rosea]|nr:Delta(24(24(1)))-sterol reductase [Minicystis rosea]